MATHKSAIKRARQNERIRLRNRSYKSKMKTAIKKVLSCTDREVAEKELRETISLLDKLAAKRIIHPNKAANKKSRLTRYVNSLSASVT